VSSAVPSPGQGTAPSTIDPTRLTILTVDDNSHMRTLLRTILMGLGIRRVLEAGDAADALELLRSTVVDAMLLDQLMPIMSGVELLTLIRRSADSPNVRLPVVMVTGAADKSTVLAARNAGVNAFVAKPLTAKDLAAKLAFALNDPRVQIQTSTYVGPCRRVRQDPRYTGPERRRQPDDALFRRTGDEWSV
jgi:two-component system, chemotaxis family, chemotaxis protein CheY